MAKKFKIFCKKTIHSILIKGTYFNETETNPVLTVFKLSDEIKNLRPIYIDPFKVELIWEIPTPQPQFIEIFVFAKTNSEINTNKTVLGNVNQISKGVRLNESKFLYSVLFC